MITSTRRPPFQPALGKGPVCTSAVACSPSMVRQLPSYRIQVCGDKDLASKATPSSRASFGYPNTLAPSSHQGAPSKNSAQDMTANSKVNARQIVGRARVIPRELISNRDTVSTETVSLEDTVSTELIELISGEAVKQVTYPSLLCGQKPLESANVSKDLVWTPGVTAAPHLAHSGSCVATSLITPFGPSCGDVDTFTPCSGHDAGFAATSSANKVMLEIITSLAHNDSKLKSKVRECINAIGDGNGINKNTVVAFRSVVSKALGLPETVFPEIERQHLRFDVDGCGTLGEFEAYKLVKMNLWEHRKKLAKYSSGVIIHVASLAGAGYDILKELGHGNQCRANLARDRTGQHWCIKTYTKARTGALELEGLKQEYEVLQHLGKHEHIAAVWDIFQDADFYYMVQELYQGGDFTTLQERASRANVSTTEDWWRGIFKQCFQGLEHIHQHALMHGDIKESNLMLKTEDYSRPTVVIIDFGLVQTVVSDAKVLWGTPGYIAPETWETGNAYPGGDCFAMGVVMMQMLLDKIPPHHNPPKGEVLPDGIFTKGLKTIHEVGFGTRSRTPPFESLAGDYAVLTELLRRLLEKEVQRRPSARMVLQDAWFALGNEETLLEGGFSEFFRTWFA